MKCILMKCCTWFDNSPYTLRMVAMRAVPVACVSLTQPANKIIVL